MNIPAAHEAAFDKMQAGPEAPDCECGYSPLGTYWDEDDHGGKVLIVATQTCECGRHHEEHRA